MRIRELNWWYREERRKRLQSVSGPTLLAAKRLGFFGDTGESKKTRLNFLILGFVLLLIFLTPLAASIFERTKNNSVSNEAEEVLSDTVRSASEEIVAVANEDRAGGNFLNKKSGWRKIFNSEKSGNSNHHFLTSTNISKASLYLLLFFGAVMIVSSVAGAAQIFTSHSLPGAMQDAWRYWQGLEQGLRYQNNLATLLKQMVFLSVCERVLLPGQKLSALYTLMFCSIVTYCLGYAAEIFYRQHWNLFVRVGGPTSSIRHLALSTTNIVLEWTKAVTFITTVVFLLLMLGLEKGLVDYTPTAPYMMIATLYWVASERVCTKTLTNWLLDHRLVCFETLEEVYLPLLLEIIQLSMIGLFTVPCLLMGNFKLGLAGILVIRVEYLQFLHDYFNLSSHLAKLSYFRPASPKELSQLNDRCAICLATMDTARVTSCQHYYHAECLLQLLKLAPHEGPKCPICQTGLEAVLHNVIGY